MTIYKRTEITEVFQVIYNEDNKYMCTNIWMHINTVRSEQLSLLQVKARLRQESGVGETEGPQWTCEDHYNTQKPLQISNPKKVSWIQEQFSVTPI